jgi:hypothetical protein
LAPPRPLNGPAVLPPVDPRGDAIALTSTTTDRLGTAGLNAAGFGPRIEEISMTDGARRRPITHASG